MHNPLVSIIMDRINLRGDFWGVYGFPYISQSRLLLAVVAINALCALTFGATNLLFI